MDEVAEALSDDAEFAEAAGDKMIAELREERVGEQDVRADVLVQPLNAGGEIHGIADHGVIKFFCRANVPRRHQPCVKANARSQGASVQFDAGSPVEPPCCEGCLARMVRVGDRRAPRGKNGVADKVHDVAVVFEDVRGGEGKIVNEHA
jgi:hypothetical protein